jgi:hypothetical protein
MPTKIHFTRDQAVWIAESFQGFGPTGRANVQYSEKSWAPIALDERAARVVHGVVDQRTGQKDRHVVLTRLLPRLADVRAPHLDLLEPVGLPRAP